LHLETLLLQVIFLLDDLFFFEFNLVKNFLQFHLRLFLLLCKFEFLLSELFLHLIQFCSFSLDL